MSAASYTVAAAIRSARTMPPSAPGRVPPHTTTPPRGASLPLAGGLDRQAHPEEQGPWEPRYAGGQASRSVRDASRSFLRASRHFQRTTRFGRPGNGRTNRRSVGQPGVAVIRRIDARNSCKPTDRGDLFGERQAYSWRHHRRNARRRIGPAAWRDPSRLRRVPRPEDPRHARGPEEARSRADI